MFSCDKLEIRDRSLPIKILVILSVRSVICTKSKTDKRENSFIKS